MEALRIAIVGASRDRSKYGNKAVRAYKERGATVYPVNPHAEEVEGLKAYPSLLDLPEAVDQASFYVPPAVGEALIEQAAQVGVKQVWLNPGSESEALIQKAEALGVEPIVACSVLGIGRNPEEM